MQFLTQTRRTLLFAGVFAGIASVAALAAPRHEPHPEPARQAANTPAGPPAARPQADASAAPTDLPRLVLLVHRPPKAAQRNEDPTIRLTDTLEAALTDSKRFEVVAYSPDQPSIKRVLLEKTLAVSDLIAPIKSEALGRIAHALGAHYALLLDPAFDRQGFASDLTFLSDRDNNEWRPVLVDRIVVPNIPGRSHLKPAAVIALAVDAITSRVGAPSHLADGMKIVPDRLVRMSSEKPRTETHAHAKAVDQPANRQPDIVTGTTTKSDTAATTPSPDSATGASAHAAPASAAHVSPKSVKKTAMRSVDKNVATGKADSKATPNKGAGEATHTIASSSVASPTHSAGDDIPVDTAPATPRPDFAGMAQRYQNSGDTASAILFWRRAVTLEPYRPDLRRHLIQAYVERHMANAAREEAIRSMALLPNDTDLMRLFADTLVAANDMPGALKVLQDVARRAPQDVVAQVALADALLADNQYAAALDAYHGAAHIDAHSPLPHRRLARVYVGQAESDLQQYGESLKEIALARSLTPPGDTASYENDYVPLMARLDTRLHDQADTLQDLYEAAIQGKKTTTELIRATADLRERVTALADYLDALPPAAGQDDAHAHYTQAAALLLQGVGTFRHYLTANNVNLEDARGPMQVARMDTLSALNLAGKKLAAAHTAVKNTN